LLNVFIFIFWALLVIGKKVVLFPLHFAKVVAPEPFSGCVGEQYWPVVFQCDVIFVSIVRGWY